MLSAASSSKHTIWWWKAKPTSTAELGSLRLETATPVLVKITSSKSGLTSRSQPGRPNEVAGAIVNEVRAKLTLTAMGTLVACSASRTVLDLVMTTPTELVFHVEEAPDGGYIARAFGVSIVTEADDLPGLRTAVRDAVRCHFEPANMPKFIRLHIVHDEVIAA